MWYLWEPKGHHVQRETHNLETHTDFFKEEKWEQKI